MLADINGIVAGLFTLSAPKKARTNDAMKRMHEHALKILVTIRIAVERLSAPLGAIEWEMG
jgi:hypothetical protein